MTIKRRFLAAPLAAVLVLAACGDDSDEPAASDITIEEAWVRQPATGQTVAAGYATITNTSDETITLVGASAPVTATFELHETLMDDEGVMSMQEREGGFEIAAGETFTLEPGGPHVMMLEVDPAEFTGPIDLTFVFDGIDPITLSAELREIAGDSMGDMGHDDMEMDGDMEMDDGEMKDGEMEDGAGERLPDPMDGDDMAPTTEE